jgi:mono/diheme cytochrome c family protein
VLGATETRASLSGGVVQQWLAPNISSDPLAGLGDKPIADIVSFLRTGANTSMGVAFGPMSEVVHDSLRYLTDADVTAIATYLKEGPDRKETGPAADATAASLRRGQALYLQNCAQCHQDNGRGIPGAIPNLAGNAAVTGELPHDIIAAMLNGLQSQSGIQMPSFAGALTDQGIADIANYIRVSWANKATPDSTPQMVEAIRNESPVGAAGTEAARDFDCPKVGASQVPGAVISPADANLMAGTGDARNRIDGILYQLRKQNPAVTDASLTNSMMAAVCPAVADNSGLTNQQKRARLMQLYGVVREEISAITPNK